ncbi:hypothetical protein RUND412_001197 [Rhizina undulata]
MIARRTLLRQSRAVTTGARSFGRSLTTTAGEGAEPLRDVGGGVGGMSVAEDYGDFRRFKNTIVPLGAKITPQYRPHLLTNHPPRPRDITLELLLSTGAHLGHATSLWNPANQRYIFGVRNGIHILSLDIIASHLRRAAKVVEGVAQSGGAILFVGTRPGQERCVVTAAKNSGGYHLFEKWIPGTITNGQRIVGRGRVVERDGRDRVVKDVQDPDAVRPDLVVCLNLLENYVLLHECGLYGIPTVGIVDTDCDPTWVTYPIPANDDSLRAVQLIAGVLGRAGQEGRTRRIRQAEIDAERRAMGL